MRLLVDNTLIHRVGNVLDSNKGSAIQPVDALAIFHFAEHILFSEEIVACNFENVGSYERTFQLIEKLQLEGVGMVESGAPLVSMETVFEEEYAELCREAAWSSLEDFLLFKPSDLDHLSKLVNQSSIPDNIKIPSIGNWICEKHVAMTAPEDVIGSIAQSGTSHIEYLLLSCRPLINKLREIESSLGGFSPLHSAVILVVLRIHVNQELAKRRSCIYSPAPQRARVSASSGFLFRQRLEYEIEKTVSNLTASQPSKLLQELKALDTLPLPLFAMFALRNSKATSPFSILEEARLQRENKDIKRVRSWLKKWETKLSSENTDERLSALQEIDKWREEIELHLTGEEASIFASLQPGIDWEFDPITNSPSWSLHLPATSQMWAPIRRKFDRNRIFIAAMARDLTTDNMLGTRIVKQLNRYPLR